MILIVSDPGDAHTRQVVMRLREKGAKVSRIDLQEIPQTCGLSAWVDNGSRARVRAQRTERRGDGDTSRIDLDDVTSIWFRRISRVTLDDSLEGTDADFAREESIAFVYSVGAMLADRFCVNPLTAALATDHGKGKLSQLEAARKIGMKIPRTLATNDPDCAFEFLSSCEKGAIYKPLRPPTRNVAGKGEKERWATVFTTKVDKPPRDSLERVRFAPCLFQELVPKRIELRVTVMGEKIFATEIHSQVHEAGAVDFRRFQAMVTAKDGTNLPHEPHDLPPALAEQIRILNRALGLVFGAYDFILTPDGEHIFLEVNQQGQFLWLEQLTGQPLLDNFCEMLIQGKRDFTCDAKPHAPGPFEQLGPMDPYDVDPEE